jgi:hypothetical protein
METFDREAKEILAWVFVPLLLIAFSLLFTLLFERWLGKNIAYGLGVILGGLISYPVARKIGFGFSLWAVLTILTAAILVFHDWGVWVGF